MDKAMKNKILLLSLIWATTILSLSAQHAPTQLNYRSAPTAIQLTWRQNDFTTETICDQGYLITHEGIGYAGADVSLLQHETLGLSINGIQANHNSSYWLADDFYLLDPAYLGELEFWVFQNQYFNQEHSAVTEVFIDFYDQSPMEGGQPFYSQMGNVMKCDEFANAFRLSETEPFTDRYRPLYKITADMGIDLPEGHYWIAVSYNATESSYVPTCTALGEIVYGDAMLYNGGTWEYINDYAISHNLDLILALPFRIKGQWIDYEQPRPIGFNVYRDGEQVNDFLVTDTHFWDRGLDESTMHTYTVGTVYSDYSEQMSEPIQAITTQKLDLTNLTSYLNVNEVHLQWERPAVNAHADISYDIYIEDQFIGNVEETSFTRGYFEQGEVLFRVNVVYADGEVVSGSNILVEINDCFQPANLTVEVEGNNVTLSWEQPLEEYRVTSFTGEYENCLGTSGFYCEWAVAQRYLPDQLEDYRGLALNKVAFYAGGSHNVYSIQIWTDNGWGGPDHLILNQQVPDFKVYDWNTVYLETPLVINPDYALWVVVNSCQTAPGEVFGVSHEFVDMHGNLVYEGFGNNNAAGWRNETCGGCIKAYWGGDSKVAIEAKEVANYNIYRNGELLAANYPDQTYLDLGLADGTYHYGVQSVEGDCTSAMANATVVVDLTGLDEKPSASVTTYPNPGNSTLNIRTTMENGTLQVFDLQGRKMIELPLVGVLTTVNTELWPKGIYFWKAFSNGKEAETGKWIKE